MVKVTCPKCDGAGKVDISEPLMDTLLYVRENPGCTAIEAHRALDTANDFHPTAFNNRLDYLTDIGLLTRKKSGRAWKYRPATKAKKK